MKAHNYTIIRRKVNSAVGSMAIEGIVVSRKMKADMLRIACGKTTAAKVKRELIAHYKKIDLQPCKQLRKQRSPRY